MKVLLLNGSPRKAGCTYTALSEVATALAGEGIESEIFQAGNPSMEAVKEAAEYEAQDKKRKEGIDAKNDADSMVFQTEKAMEEVGDKLDANDKTAVEADLAALKSLIEKSNPDEMTDAQVAEIKAAKDKLMESAQKLFAKVYEQSQGAAGSAAGGQDNGSAGQSYQNNDDVVDGDYKEV